MKITRLASLLTFGLITATAHAQLSFTGTNLTQDFDSLAQTGTAVAWSNNTTLAGWSLFSGPAATPAAIATYAGGTGSATAGAFYSFGVAGTNVVGDRAFGGVASGGAYFGSPASGAVAGWLAVGITNGTGAAINNFNVNYDGEQWRNGGNATAQTMVLEYGYGATFASVGAWTAPGATFNFTSPIATVTAAALDGNLATNRVAGLGGNVAGQSWGDGQTLWIRWVENNDAGNDHGLALDNFLFSVSSGGVIPEPGTLALAALGLAGLALRSRRK